MIKARSLNMKGDNFTQEMLEGFRRQWLAQVSGVENAWKTPILQSEGLEWVDLAKTIKADGLAQQMDDWQAVHSSKVPD